MDCTRITIDPQRMGGVPCIRHLRIPVATVVEMVAEGVPQPRFSGRILTLRRRTFGRLSATTPRWFPSGSCRSSPPVAAPDRQRPRQWR